MNKCITRALVCTILSVLTCQYDMFMLRKTFVKKQMPSIVQGILRRNINRDIESKQDYDSLKLDDHFAKLFVPKITASNNPSPLKSPCFVLTEFHPKKFGSKITSSPEALSA